VFYVFRNICWTDGTKKSPTQSDFPPHQLATINSPNLRPRAAINYATRPLPPVSSSPSSADTGSSFVPSSPAVRKSSSSALGRCRAKITDVQRPDALVVSKPETLDAGAYTPLLPVAANSVSSSSGSSKRQTLTDTPPIGVRPNRALPRMTSSAKTQTGSSLQRAANAEAGGRSAGNSTSGVATADSPRSHLARPTTLTPASVQRRRLPSPPRDHDDDVGRQRGSRKADAVTAIVTSPPHPTSTTSAAATSPHVTSSRLQCMSPPSH